MTTPLAPIRVARMGDFEIWRTPCGVYDMTHKGEKVTTVRALYRARELARFCQAHATGEESA